jgi:hypothetical protein
MLNNPPPPITVDPLIPKEYDNGFLILITKFKKIKNWNKNHLNFKIKFHFVKYSISKPLEHSDSFAQRGCSGCP